MAKALALTAGLLAVALTGCSPFGGGSAFSCDSNEKCNAKANGRCEPNGFCSYADPTCISGQRYGESAGGNSGQCVGDEAPTDSGGGGDSDTEVCFGVGLVKPCFPTRPTGDVRPGSTINTVSSQLCSTVVTDADGFCVIAGENIFIEQSVAVTGSRPLILVANAAIEISARLDVASHHSTDPNPPYSTTQIGAGSGPAACAAVTGTIPVNGGTNGGGGGGAGGTFGAAGGPGGNAPEGGVGGMPGTPQPVTAFRGGCPGQNGIRGTFGTGGHGGGAVYLIANTAISITSGGINASGEGGLPALLGSAGGGGGGSGGMIVLDAPTIMNMSVIFANGGSGGEGSSETTRGDPGPEPNSAAASTAPAGNIGVGGDGGGGGAGGTAGGTPNGSNGLAGTAAGTNDGGGGGGGGGTGVIKVYRGTITGTGSHSPQPTP